MFLTDAEIKTALAATLKIEESSLPGEYDTIIPQAHSRAYRDIVNRLMRRGFTAEQIDDWDDGEEFERDLAIFWCLKRASVYQGYDLETLKTFDRRGELKSCLLQISGEWVKPTGDQPSLSATAGPAASGGIWNWPDPNDPSLGEYTKW